MPDYTPNFEEFKKLTTEYNLVPVYREITADLETPVSAYLKVARGPFLEDGAGRQAYILDGNLAVLSPIEVGAISIGEVEIVSGLREGDQIIISDMTRFQSAETILIRQ